MKWTILLLCTFTLDARSLFTMGSVRLFFNSDKTVQAELLYHGSGQMEGRWELLRPGEEQPELISRIRIFLPPSGKMTLTGPEWSHLRQDSNGAHSIYLRVERVSDKSGDAELRVTSIPVLRYWAGKSAPTMALVSPEDGALSQEVSPELRFSTGPDGIYRIEIADPLEHIVLRALLPAGAVCYRLPSWIQEKLAGKTTINWRLSAIGSNGEVESSTPWWFLALETNRKLVTQ